MSDHTLGEPRPTPAEDWAGGVMAEVYVGYQRARTALGLTGYPPVHEPTPPADVQPDLMPPESEHSHGGDAQ